MKTVTYQGKTLTLQQDAYISDTVGKLDHYKASAIDAEGETYTVWWAIINFECEDESESCDWDEHEVIKN